MALGAMFVLRRRFDPEATLAGIAEHRCEALVVVPVMLQRILELPADVRERHDTSSLRVVAASGSALPADLAQRWMDAFGDNLFNLYGSTEVSQATIATPEDLRERPGPPGGHPEPWCASTGRTGGPSRRARRDGSSSATACCSRATRAAATRTGSTA